VLLWFFLQVPQVKLRAIKYLPGLVASGVILAVCGLAFLRRDWCERLECMSFDLRAREALRFLPPAGTNLGFVFINEESVKQVWGGTLGYRFGLHWPRQVYARLIDELTGQGAHTVGMDIILGELRPDHSPVQMADGQPGPDSDEFFANTMRRTGNVVIAITPDITPPELFATNALALGDISADKDPDGILRHARAFRIYRRWHAAFRQIEADPDYGVDLKRVRFERGQLVLLRNGLEDIRVPLDPEGNFDLADFWGEKLPPGMGRIARPYTEVRIWHMGIVLAARELGIDLNKAEVDLPRGRIVLRGKGGLKRTIPVDRGGSFIIDWSLPEEHPVLLREPIHKLLAQYRLRLQGKTNDLVNLWHGKIAVVGSSAMVGNNLTDRGATPLRPDTLLVSKHWNVANSLLTGRFVRRAPLPVELALIVSLGILAAILTWYPRVIVASLLVIALVIGYVVFSTGLYIHSRYWIPLFLPVVGAMLVTHLLLVTWRVVFEQAERRRIRSIFSTVVSPKIVKELLRADMLSLGGARRKITIMFADVRGFTEFTDASQELAAEKVRQAQLAGAAAEACFDEQARETLNTVNLYLGMVADTVIQHDGTLDKFIGDCVMAFWGSPTPNPQHALACVRAAIEAQRAVYRLNRQRQEENQRRACENRTRISAGLSARPLMPILFLGTGINTGMVTVGLMGSEGQAMVRQGSYTVFGREVNLASRLEGASGHARIFISQSTYEELTRDDPPLAATCCALPPINVKGIRHAVQVYEVPWMLPGMTPIDPQKMQVSAMSSVDEEGL
jgi:class 3 adenylate cyclase/CHASE2 domain-containing sensor protein